MKISLLISFLMISLFGCSQENKKNMNNKEVAVFGAGCFWCVEAVFTELKGVEIVTPGYTGGDTENPTYKDICTGTTNHAEVAKIIFDPTIITFDELLEVFWTTHDPTTLNQQGADHGTQYRSVIYYTSTIPKRKSDAL